MNTSKSLDEILIGFAERYPDYQNYVKLGEKDAVRDLLAEARKAIVEAVEGLLPPEKELAPKYPSGFDKGFNQCRSEVLQAIKEWQ